MDQATATTPAAPAAPAAPAKLGIDDLKKVVVLMTRAAKSGFEIMADGKVDLNDIPYLLELLGPIQDAIPAFKSAYLEAFDIDSEEGLDLVATVAANTGFLPAKAQKICMAIIKMIPAALELKAAIQS